MCFNNVYYVPGGGFTFPERVMLLGKVNFLIVHTPCIVLYPMCNLYNTTTLDGWYTAHTFPIISVIGM